MNNLQVIEHSNQRVLLTSQIAEAYGATSKVITDNFNNNKERYIEGKHFYCLTGDGLKQFKSETEIFSFAKNLNKLYLWTEKGALLHAKSLGTDKAWEVYDMLVETYFNAKQQSLNLNGLSPELQMFNQMFRAVANQEMKVNQLEVKQEETSKKLDTALDIFTSAIEPDWKTQINSKINQICKEHRLNYCMVRRDLYSELENAAKCNLSARVRNHQARLKKSGALYKEISAVTKIDVVANDCKLQAIFDGIVKKFQAKYVQGDNVQEGLIC